MRREVVSMKKCFESCRTKAVKALVAQNGVSQKKTFFAVAYQKSPVFTECLICCSINTVMFEVFET